MVSGRSLDGTVGVIVSDLFPYINHIKVVLPSEVANLFDLAHWDFFFGEKNWGQIGLSAGLYLDTDVWINEQYNIIESKALIFKVLALESREEVIKTRQQFSRLSCVDVDVFLSLLEFDNKSIFFLNFIHLLFQAVEEVLAPSLNISHFQIFSVKEKESIVFMFL